MKPQINRAAPYTSEIAAMQRKSLRTAQDQRPLLRDGDRMLEVSGKATVFGDSRPPVLEHFDLRSARVDHRLDGHNETRFQADAAPRRAIVRHRRVLVHLLADAIVEERAHHREAQ